MRPAVAAATAPEGSELDAFFQRLAAAEPRMAGPLVQQPQGDTKDTKSRSSVMHRCREDFFFYVENLEHFSEDEWRALVPEKGVRQYVRKEVAAFLEQRRARIATSAAAGHPAQSPGRAAAAAAASAASKGVGAPGAGVGSSSIALHMASLASPAADNRLGLRYTSMDGQIDFRFKSSAVHLVRSDGQIDCMTFGGNITSRLCCSDKGVAYVGVAAGIYATYAIRSDGKLDCFTRKWGPKRSGLVRDNRFVCIAANKTEGIACVEGTLEPADAGVRFVSGSCSLLNAYMLGSNGAIYCFKVSPENGLSTPTTKMEAADGAAYVSASGGSETSYFVRSDGKIDGRIERSEGSGVIDFTVGPVNGSPIVGVSRQLVVPDHYPLGCKSNKRNFFVRADGALAFTLEWSPHRENERKGGDMLGAIDRNGRTIDHKVSPPAGLAYLAAAAGGQANYYIRSDGAVDRARYVPSPSSLRASHWQVTSTRAPPPGTTYVQVVTGWRSIVSNYACLLRSDGVVDWCRDSADSNFIRRSLPTLAPSHAEPGKANGSSCVVM